MNNRTNITENEYAHWLFNVPGIGKTSIDKLLCGGRSCREVYECDSSELKGILSQKQIKNLEISRRRWDFEKEKKLLKQKGITFISRIDERFPEKLKNIPDPPFALYVKGQLPDPDKPSVAIIGARMCSEYGRYMARIFGRGLAMAGVQVISGMARGVDGISQKAAISAGGNSYGILGNGVDICYPEENSDIYYKITENGGLISEFSPGTEPKANFFPMRNRIISGLADVVLVIEAREKSGTQITVDTALEQGREVLAVPGRVTDRLSDGCNQLISQGAGVALSVEDILDRLNVVRRQSAIKKDETNCEDDEKEAPGPVKERSLDEEILEHIDIIPSSVSAIVEKLYQNGIEISVPELIMRLMDLCYSGRIVQNGAYYRKLA